MPRVSSLTAPQLWNQFQQIVGDRNVNRNRDIAMLTRSLEILSPIQLLLGMYQNKGSHISVPSMLRNQDEWIVWDDDIAKVELACHLENVIPTAYYLWRELREEENADSHRQAILALSQLKDWANRIVI